MSVPFVQKIHKTTAYFLNESSFLRMIHPYISKETLCYNHKHTDNSYKFHKTHSHIYQQKALPGNKKIGQTA